MTGGYSLKALIMQLSKIEGCRVILAASVQESRLRTEGNPRKATLMSVISITGQEQQFELHHAVANSRNVPISADARSIRKSFLH